MRLPLRLGRFGFVICFIGIGIIGFLLIVMLLAAPESKIVTGIVITDAGITNIEGGRTLRLFTLYNHNFPPMRRDYYYTVYWTNSSGKQEHRFGAYPSSEVIEPGKFETVGIDPPECNGKWFADFHFRIEPGKTFRYMQGSPILRHFISSNWSQKYKALDVFIGPEIDGAAGTNQVLNAPHR